jgi:hypothetical protein
MANDVFKLAKRIKQEIEKGVEDYHTGLLGEQLIVGAYQTMPTDKLEKMRFIINGIIKKRKEMLRVQDAEVDALSDVRNIDTEAISDK